MNLFKYISTITSLIIPASTTLSVGVKNYHNLSNELQTASVTDLIKSHTESHVGFLRRRSQELIRYRGTDSDYLLMKELGNKYDFDCYRFEYPFYIIEDIKCRFSLSKIYEPEYDSPFDFLASAETGSIFNVDIIKSILPSETFSKYVNVALRLACRNNKLDFVKWLVKNHKADMNDKNSEGLDAFSCAKNSNKTLTWLKLYKYLYQPLEEMQSACEGNSRNNSSLNDLHQLMDTVFEGMDNNTKEFKLIEALIDDEAYLVFDYYTDIIKQWMYNLSNEQIAYLVQKRLPIEQDKLLLFLVDNSQIAAIDKLELTKLNKTIINHLVMVNEKKPLKGLDLASIDCERTDWALFIEQLENLSNIGSLSMTNTNLNYFFCQSGDIDKFCLALKKLINLKCLILDNNQFMGNLVQIIKGLFGHISLEKISAKNNFYEEGNKENFEHDFQQLSKSHIVEIDLSGNYLVDKDRYKKVVGKQKYNVLYALLTATGFSVKNLLDSTKFDVIEIKSGTKNRTTALKIKLTLDNIDYEFPLTGEQESILKDYHKLFQSESYNQLIEDLKKYIESGLNHYPELANLKIAEQPDREQLFTCKRLLSYHRDVRLETFFRNCPKLKTSGNSSSMPCLIDPASTITMDTWRIYLLTVRSKDLLDWKNEHAMLAFEGLTKYGQRILTLAHLRKEIRAGKNATVIAYHNIPISDIKTIHDKYEIISRPAEKKLIKDMWSLIAMEINDNRLINKYNPLISAISYSFFVNKGKNQAVNCLKWAVDKINRCLPADQRIPIVPGSRPSQTMHEYQQKQYRATIK